MNRLKTGTLVAWVLTAGVFGPSTSARAKPGDHIRVGELVFAPSIDVGFEHHTNTYRSDTYSIQGTHMVISPSVQLTTDSPVAEFSLSGIYYLRKYLQPVLFDLDRFSDFNVSTSLDLLKEFPVGFVIRDDVGMQGRVTGGTYRDRPYHVRLRNMLDGGMVARIGPVLELDVMGFWTLDNYYVPNIDGAVGVQEFNLRHSYGPQAELLWSFFPRTAFVLDGEYGWNRWRNNVVETANSASSLGVSLAIPDSTFFKAHLGMRGRLTKRLVLDLRAGYGQSVYDEDTVVAEGDTDAYAQDLRGVEGILIASDVRLEFGVGQQLSVGYQKDFSDSWFTNYVAFHEISAVYDGRIGPRVGTGASVRTRFEGYRGEVTRNDVLLLVDASASYAFKNWVSLGLDLGWQQRIPQPQFPTVAYGDFSTNLKATFTY